VAISDDELPNKPKKGMLARFKDKIHEEE